MHKNKGCFFTTHLGDGTKTLAEKNEFVSLGALA